MKQSVSTERVFSIFSELNRIPRPSHHEELVADYLCQFAERLHLEYERDAHNCVVIRAAQPHGYGMCRYAEPALRPHPGLYRKWMDEGSRHLTRRRQWYRSLYGTGCIREQRHHTWPIRGHHHHQRGRRYVGRCQPFQGFPQGAQSD